MTIFDVIRYPLSDDPTDEELQRIPHEIFLEWRNNVGDRFLKEDPMEEVIASLRHQILTWGETPAERRSRIWHSMLRKLKSWFQL